MPNTTRLSADRALEALKAGNARFIAKAPVSKVHNDDYAIDERPIAIILGCCDHRVPPEILFDQGLADLFTIRVAGNIATPTQIGSIEFGAVAFGPRLIVVLGHQHCGAIKATLSAHLDNQAPGSPHLDELVDAIKPACTDCADASRDEQVHELMIANIKQSVEQLRTQSTILKDLADNDGLQIIGAYYNMDEGRVQFLED